MVAVGARDGKYYNTRSIRASVFSFWSTMWFGDPSKPRLPVSAVKFMFIQCCLYIPSIERSSSRSGNNVLSKGLSVRILVSEKQEGGCFRRAFALRVLRGLEPRGGGSDVWGILRRPSANFGETVRRSFFLTFRHQCFREHYMRVTCLEK